MLSGVEDDALAFQSVEEIRKKKESKIPYEVIRRDTDRLLGDAEAYWNQVRAKYWLKLKDPIRIGRLWDPASPVLLPERALHGNPRAPKCTSERDDSHRPAPTSLLRVCPCSRADDDRCPARRIVSAAPFAAGDLDA